MPSTEEIYNFPSILHENMQKDISFSTFEQLYLQLIGKIKCSLKLENYGKT